MIATTIGFGIGQFNIPADYLQAGDLSREKTREAIGFIPWNVAICGMRELTETEDNEDLDAVLPPKDWYHLNAAGEVDLMVKKGRFVLCPKENLPGKITNAEYVVQLTPGWKGRSPIRQLTQGIFLFKENPTFSPLAVLNTHWMPGVYEGQKDNLQERKQFQQTQYNLTQERVLWLTGNGCNVVLIGDPNYQGGQPKMHPDQVNFFNERLSIVAFMPSRSANWNLTLAAATPDLEPPERHKTPADHTFNVANVIARANANYGKTVQPTPPVKVGKVEQGVEAWPAKWKLSKVASDELRAIVKGA